MNTGKYRVEIWDFVFQALDIGDCMKMWNTGMKIPGLRWNLLKEVHFGKNFPSKTYQRAFPPSGSVNMPHMGRDPSFNRSTKCPPGNYHIPSWEKGHHVRAHLGWGYVGREYTCVHAVFLNIKYLTVWEHAKACQLPKASLTHLRNWTVLGSTAKSSSLAA